MDCIVMHCIGNVLYNPIYMSCAICEVILCICRIVVCGRPSHSRAAVAARSSRRPTCATLWPTPSSVRSGCCGRRSSSGCSTSSWPGWIGLRLIASIHSMCISAHQVHNAILRYLCPRNQMLLWCTCGHQFFPSFLWLQDFSAPIFSGSQKMNDYSRLPRRVPPIPWAWPASLLVAWCWDAPRPAPARVQLFFVLFARIATRGPPLD